ncbi:uncharacterized protein LOC109714043 [Ananas comosus]|uniref:Uncharacterized protein LOC109714043 n=1 Tax=Ananas comosus TaxID=4615 RepID=A0A6P5FKT1_ANACO|nr:uncharacterized protein LOC109714043 [Ananas comosus]
MPSSPRTPRIAIALRFAPSACASGFLRTSMARAGAEGGGPFRRVRAGEPGLLFASTDRVRLGDGARFEAYAGEEKVVSGVFRLAGGGGPGWRTECRGCEEAVAAEVWVVGESGAVLRERVEIAAEEKGRRRRRTTLGLGFRSKLEEIPEESDGCKGGADDQEEEEEGRRSDSEVVGSDGWDRREEEGIEGGDRGLEMEMEGVRWAVDVGIWVVCLGVGLLVSRASARSFSRKRLF